MYQEVAIIKIEIYSSVYNRATKNLYKALSLLTSGVCVCVSNSFTIENNAYREDSLFHETVLAAA